MDKDDQLLHSIKFHERVKHIVSENDHLKDWLKNLQIESKIKDQVSVQVEKIRQSVNTLKSDALLEMNNTIPGKVSQEIAQQMPFYLSQNADMQRLMQNHISEIKQELETKARAILQDIVSDPEYHTINKTYFDAFEEKGNEHLRRLKDEQTILQAKLETKVDKKMDSITKLEDKVDNLETSLSNTQFYLYLSCIGLCVLTTSTIYMSSI